MMKAFAEEEVKWTLRIVAVLANELPLSRE